MFFDTLYFFVVYQYFLCAPLVAVLALFTQIKVLPSLKQQQINAAGINHASVQNGERRGTVSWIEDTETYQIKEYGNPHSVMGKGNIEEYQVNFEERSTFIT